MLSKVVMANAQQVEVPAKTLEKGDRYIERGETGRVIGRFTCITSAEKCTGDPSNIHVMVVKDGEKGERVACWYGETWVSVIA